MLSVSKKAAGGWWVLLILDVGLTVISDVEAKDDTRGVVKCVIHQQDNTG